MSAIVKLMMVVTVTIMRLVVFTQSISDTDIENNLWDCYGLTNVTSSVSYAEGVGYRGSQI